MTLLWGYLLDGIYSLRSSLLMGTIIYMLILLFLYIFKIRRIITYKCIPELLLSIYGIAILKITGIFSLSFSLNGLRNINLIPFVGGSVMMILLNFLLFLPLGVLLPVVFSSCKKNMKKVVLIGFSLSLGIELMQLFGGRYAEIDDLIVNTVGTLSGYVFYSIIAGWKENYKRSLISAAAICIALIIGFTGIYYVSDNESAASTGLDAVQDSIAQINVYLSGEKKTVDQDADTYGILSMQLANCSGIIIEPKSVSGLEVLGNKDALIEVVYSEPQTITFENAPDFEITDADRLLYNADRNILYWGNGSYQKCLDYAKFDGDLQEHSKEILEQYKELEISIEEHFN